MMKNIPLFAPTFDIETCLTEIRECLDIGWTGIGFKTIEFEKKFGEYIGKPYCHFVNSNTNGIHLLLEILKRTRKWNNNDEVISTALTFVSANHSILHAGLNPVFADIDETLCINCKTIEAKISERTRAVQYVPIGGNAADIENIAALCRERGLVLILDAAHAAGSKLGERHLCNYADYSVFSYQAVKNLPTGDSGLIVLNSTEEDTLARQLSWCGINKDTYYRSKDGYKWQYSVDEVGFKYHGNSIMAGIAIAQLAQLDNGNVRRREIAAAYREALKELPQVRYLAHVNENESSHHLVQFFCQERNELIEFLGKNGIGSGVHYLPNTHYPMYAEQRCPVAERLSEQIITLPIHLRLTDDDITYVADTIKEFYRD